MQHISKDLRRATTDFDLDFVRYSIEDASIKEFLAALNKGTSDFSVELHGTIEELKHQDYSGKRIHIRIKDSEGNATQYYLWHDIYREPNYLGCPYLDADCDPNFSGLNSVVFGHNMGGSD